MHCICSMRQIMSTNPEFEDEVSSFSSSKDHSIDQTLLLKLLGGDLEPCGLIYVLFF
ncbi:hypothetical protein HanRHA438_Chr08g0330911 [Helianthus annuus]|nr:hypothetical protein HanRHA438_Chr08g0330911 [Helianthus annuus]